MLEEIQKELRNQRKGIQGADANPMRYLSETQLSWLISQAKKMEKIQKFSNAEEMTLAEFAKETLKVIEGRDIPTRKKRS